MKSFVLSVMLILSVIFCAGSYAADAVGSAWYTDGSRSAQVRYIDDDTIAMTVSGRVYLMERATSASGARYEAVGYRGVEFWEKGTSAYITVDHERIDTVMELVSTVRPDDIVQISTDGGSFAMRRVASDADLCYTAIGDPLTRAEMRGHRGTLFVRGERVADFILTRDDALPVSPDELRLYSADTVHVLTGTHEDGRMIYTDLRDPSTRFEASGDIGTLTIAGRVRFAYDASPAPMPRVLSDVIPSDAEWIVTEIGGKPANGISDITIAFDRGAIRGRAHVNSFHASAIIMGRRMIVDEIASTKMMGPIEFMEREDDFFRILKRAAWFETYADSLTIISSDGKTITAKRVEAETD